MDLRSQLQRTLGDSYTLERELEGGGMARVFVARDQQLGRQVVVKTLADDSGVSVSAERFRREIRLAASLQQANIVPVHSAGDVDGVPYYTMPFVEGESLRAHMDKRGALDVREAVNILRDVARALAFAHERGVVHRDIKPENILLSGSTAVVTDFGIAKAIEASHSMGGATTLTQLGTLLGTPAYISPEQAAGDPHVDHLADIYSLGIVAYEMLAGSRPFTVTAARALLAAHVNEAPPLISTKREGLPPRLASLVMRCLEKEPERRPQKALDLLEALESALTASQSSPTTAPSIAVLPFANLSPDAADGFFADGLTDEIITDLSGITSLRVIARAAMMRYKGTEKEPAVVARELRVRYVLDGSVRRAGDSMRLTARLLDTEADSVVWSDKLSGKVEDVFEMQERVSRTIVDALKVRLSPREERRLAERPIEDLRAYEAYLQAKQAMWNFGPESLAKARELLQLAVSRVGENPVLLSALGEVAIHAISAGAANIKAEAEIAEGCARRLAASAPDSFGRYALQGILHWRKGEMREAIATLTKAHEREPGDVEVVAYLEYAYLMAGRDDRAREISKLVVTLDPVTPLMQVMPAFCDLMTGRARDVLDKYAEFAAREPLNPLAQFWLLCIRAEGGDVAGMRESARDLVQRWPQSEFGAAARLALETLDDPDAAARLTVPLALRAISAESEAIARSLTWLFARLGAHEAALDALEDAIARGLAHYPHLARDCQSLEGVRGHPRFQRLLAIVRERWERGGTSAEDLATSRAAPIAFGTKPVIAVLPLTNMSASADDEYFADGMTEDIIAQLSQIASLKVISRTSAMGYKGSKRRPRDIAEELDASHVIEGSVRRAGTRVRIVAQLMDAKSEAHLWSETFDRNLDDIFAIQSELAQRITAALVARITPAEARRVAKRPTQDMEAYNLFLLGRQEYGKASPQSFARAEEYYDQAIARDPSFARAYAAKALVHMYHGGGYWGVKPTVAYERAVALARKAIELDPDVGEAHMVLGAYESWITYDWRASAAHFERSIALTPSHAFTYIMHGWLLFATGRFEEAIQAGRLAIELDPVSPLVHANAISFCHVGRRPKDFEAGLAAARRLSATQGVDVIIRTFHAIANGSAAEILRETREIAQGSDNIFLRALLGWCAAAAGDESEARAILAELHALEASTYVWGTGFALIYAHLGEADRAFDHLERAYQERAGWMNVLGTSPAFDPFRGDARFSAMLRKVGVVVHPDLSRQTFAPIASRKPSVRAPERQPAKPSIAVLPLTNMSASADDEYFADGMTEDIIAQLSQIASLKVISRTSVMRYKRTDKTLGEIAGELNATHLMEGSVRRAANRLRIVLQLRAAASEAALWTETFERDNADLFAVQAEIAERVAEALRSKLTSAERGRVAKRPTDNLDAYNLYLLGRHHFSQVSADSMAKGIECYTRAIELDPKFAKVYGALAMVYVYHGGGYWGMRPKDAYAKATDLAHKALAIDPDVADAHEVLGHYEQWIRYDWAAARPYLARAIELDPGFAFHHVGYGIHLLTVGRLAEAVEGTRRALELDPVSTSVRGNLIYYLICARRLDEALNEIHTADQYFQPDDPWRPILRMWALLPLGRADEAVADLQALVARQPSCWSSLHLATALAAAGRADEARALLPAIHAKESTEYVWAPGLAIAYAQLGEMNRAFHYLEQAFEDRAGTMQLIASDPMYDPLRDDARFDAIVKRVAPVITAETLQAFERTPPRKVQRRAISPLVSDRKSVAVLPFANLSPDPENEFFADGITDDLIAQVAKIGSLRVIARTSVMRYRGVQDAARTAAKELGVSAVVEGTVRRAGKRARIVAQLIDASSDAPIWSETYDRDLEDVFSVQTDVATSVAGALKATLTPGEQRRLSAARTIDAATYDLYLLGRHHANKRTDESIRKGIAYFERCIAKEPRFAAAYAGMADAYVFAGIGYATFAQDEAYGRAREAADAALAIDDASPEGLCALGLCHMFYEWSPANARTVLERAIALNPNHAPAHQWLAWSRFSLGDYIGAVKTQELALRLDPLSVTLITESGWPFSYAGLHDLAQKRYLRALELDPSFALARYNLGLTYHGLGRYDEAITAYEASSAGLGRVAWLLSWMGITHFAAGRRDKAESILRELQEQSRTDARAWLQLAVLLDAMGRPDEALTALDRAVETRSSMVWVITLEGYFPLENIRATPRFRAALARIGAEPHDLPRQRALLLEHEQG